MSRLPEARGNKKAPPQDALKSQARQTPPPSGPRLSDPFLNVVLVEPEIPPNTGTVARLCAGTGCHLILVGKLGFELTDASLKRAGLDYWKYVSWEHLESTEAFFEQLPDQAFHLLSTHATQPYTRMPVARGDYLVFGKETKGLPKPVLEAHPKQCYTIPIIEPGVRSLNLGLAAGVVVYDALRRITPF